MEKTADTGPHQIKIDSWISCAPFEQLLNMEILEAENGTARLTMPFVAEMANGGGLMHGGALISLADTAVAMAIKSVVEHGTHFATISSRNEFRYPVTRGIVTAIARVVEVSGRTLEGEAVVFDEDERQVMKYVSTFKIARDARMKNVVIGS